MPHYILLCHQSPGTGEAPHGDDGDPVAISLEELRAAGVLVDVQRLEPPGTATTVRVRGQETQVTDGPFAVTKEMLAGFYVLDCADLDEAVRWAGRIPGARSGAIEVRPLGPPVDPSAGARRGVGAGTAG